MTKKLKKKSAPKSTDKFDFIDFLNAKYGTKDSDNDGLTDEVEKFLGTDSYKADTDGDGMSDAAEIRAGRNPLGPGTFRDWFTAHEGNNFHPHALHPKRLMFYATSAVAMKILVFIFVIGLPMTAWLSPDVLREQADKIISLTNQLRVQQGVKPLSENQALNKAAYAKANDMILQQYFAHVGPDKRTLADWLKAAGYRYEVAGENLAMGFATPQAVMAAWQKSQTHYANLIDPDFSEIGVGVLSGPYQGADTVFVAQYFGTPIPVVIPVKASTVSNTPQPNKQVITTSTPIATSTPAQVLSVAIKDLTKPVLLNFDQVNHTNQSSVDLNIFSPGATEVWLMGKDNKIMAKATANGAWQLTLPLTAGKNIFYLVAKNSTKELASDNYEIISDSQAPLIDLNKTKLTLDLPQDSAEAVARAEVYLSSDAASAELSFGDYKIDLTPTDNGLWSGQLLVPDRKSLEPIVPPEIKVTDTAGNTKTYGLSWTNMVPMNSSVTDRYFFLRANPNGGLAKIFGLSDWFYRLILFGAVITLLVAVLAETKSHHLKLILPTSGFIVLLIILLIF